MMKKFYSENQKGKDQKEKGNSRNKGQKQEKDKQKNKFSLPPNNGNNNFNWKNASKTSLMWIIIIVSTFLLFSILGFNDQDEVKISTYQYKQQLESGNITDAEIVGKTFHGTLQESRQMD